MSTTVSLRANDSGHVIVPIHFSITSQQHSGNVFQLALGWIDDVIWMMEVVISEYWWHGMVVSNLPGVKHTCEPCSTSSCRLTWTSTGSCYWWGASWGHVVQPPWWSSPVWKEKSVELIHSACLLYWLQHASDQFQRPKSSSKKSGKIYRTRKPT